MKIGMRKPNIKKSIKAKTTGKLKRSVKKSINPLYGKKGIGLINNPKKAVYNKIYNKTTFGVNDIIGSSSSTKVNTTNNVMTWKEIMSLKKSKLQINDLGQTIITSWEDFKAYAHDLKVGDDYNISIPKDKEEVYLKVKDFMENPTKYTNEISKHSNNINKSNINVGIIVAVVFVLVILLFMWIS